MERGWLGRLPGHGPGFKFQGWPGNLGQDGIHVCFEINFSDRKEGLTVSSIICDRWQYDHKWCDYIVGSASLKFARRRHKLEWARLLLG